MYVIQDGKLYIQDGDMIVGVDVHPHIITKVEGTETTVSGNYKMFDGYEIKRKYHIVDGECYIFPRDIEEIEENGVDINESIDNIKKPTRKSTSKR